MLVVGVLLIAMCRLDVLGHDLPRLFWTGLSAAVALWLLASMPLLRKAPLLGVPALVLLYLFPFNFSSFEAVGIPNESRLLHYFRSNNLVGAVVGIHVQGKTYFASYGGVEKYGDLPSSRTPYQIASVTKVFTGDVLSRQLDSSLIPLATHSAGLPDIAEVSGFALRFLSHPFDFYAHYGAADLVRDLAPYQHELREGRGFAVGEWHYSNLGFCLLGRKLDMANRRFGNIGYVRPANVAAGYNGVAARTTLWSPGICHGAGGLHASAADLLDYIRLPSPAKTIHFDDGEHMMGLGWMFQDGIWYHAGATFGNTAFVAYEPSSDTALVILISGVAREIESFGLEFVADLRRLESAQRIIPPDAAR